jgi:hypothetical protein
MTSDELLKRVQAVLKDGFGVLTGAITPEIEAAFSEAGIEMVKTIRAGGDTDRIAKVIDRDAAEYARLRAGELIKNFASTTPEMLRTTVETAIEKGWSAGELRDALVDHYAFSPERGLAIARTEMGTSRSHGQLNGAKRAGAKKKAWDADEGACDICMNNAAVGWIDLDEEFPSGDLAPSAHPNDSCGLIFQSEDVDQDATDDDGLEEE